MALALSALLAMSAAAPIQAADVQTIANVRHAVAAAVASRMGGDVLVSIDALTAVRLADGLDGLLATPDAAARLGQPARFTITASTGRGRTRVGEVTATVSVTADVVRTVRSLSRGAVVGAADVQAAREMLLDTPLRPIPTYSSAVGARVTRDLSAGALVSGSDLIAEALVKNNTTVRALVRLGTVEIEGELLAMDSGARGDIIRVTNPGTRRVLRARVVGKERVEVISK